MFEMNDKNTLNSTLAMCVYYLIIGTVAILANFLNLAMYLRSKESRKTYRLFIAMEVGELINSLSFILTGMGRLQTLDQVYSPITAHDCFFKKYWPHALILGTEIPTLFLILTSIERICAVCMPSLFNQIFSKQRQTLLICACVALAAASLGAAGASAYNNQKASSDSGHCGIIHSTARWFSTFHFIFIILGYGFSLISLVVMKAYSMKLRERSSSDAAGKKAQRRDSKTNILIAFAAASFLLVAVPSIVMIGLKWKLIGLMDDKWIALAYSTTVMVSIANMIINFAFRDDFRQQCLRWTSTVGITHHKESVNGNRKRTPSPPSNL